MLLVCELFAQTDTVFWFAPTYVNPTNGNGPIFLRLANSTNQPTSVRVYTPANTTTGVNININIPANSNSSVNLTPFLNVLTDVVPDRIKNTGIKIESQRNITAYYEVVGRAQSNLSNNMTNPEIFVLKGENALGTTFFVPAQNFWFTDNNPDSDGIDGKTLPGWYAGQARSTIDIVATQDNTTITITPTRPYRNEAGVVVTNLAPLSRVLNRGQVYTLEAAFWAPDQHLGGTKIVSNKPIAVTDKDDTVKEGGSAFTTGFGYDLLGDQLVPANVVGTEYLVVQGFMTPNTPTGQNDYVFMIPTENGTFINADGANIPGGPFAAGQLVRFLVNKTAVRIFSTSSASSTEADPSKPIYVYHVTGVANELASAILPSTNCSGSSSVTFSRTDLPADALDFYVNIIVRDGGENSFSINGNPAPNLGFSAPIGGWRYARILNSTLFPLGTHTVSNSAAVFHLAIFFGASQKGASYGYFSDFGSFKVDLGLDRFNCVTDKVSYQLPNYPKIEWTSNTFAGIKTTNPLIADFPGQYIVTITDNNRCRSKDTVNVAYAPDVKIEQLDRGRPVCLESQDPAKTKLAINKSYDQYKWIFPDGSVIENTQTITPKGSGIYTIEVTNFFGTNRQLACSAKDTTLVKVRNNFFDFKGYEDSTLLCNIGNNVLTLNLDTIKNNPYFGVSINWFKNGTNLNKPNVWSHDISSQGMYRANVKDKFDCDLRDSLFVNYVDKITVDLGGDSVVACLGDPEVQTPLVFRANPTGNYDYEWTTDNGVSIPRGTTSFAPTVAGKYTLKSSDKTFPACFGQATTYVVRPKDSLTAPWNNKRLIDCEPFGRLAPLCGSSEATIFTWFKNDAILPGVNSRCYGEFSDDSASYRVVMEKFYTSNKKCIGDAIAYILHYDTINPGLKDGDQPFCAPHEDNAIVTATPGFSKYVWKPNVSTSNTFKPTASGRYDLEVTNKDGCLGKGFTDVILVPDISLKIDTGDNIACWYEGYTIRPGEGVGDFKFKYEWFGTDTPLPSTQSTYKPTKSGTYKVIVTTLIGGCKDSASVNVEFINQFNINIGPDRFICDNESVNFSISPKTPFDSYHWYYNSMDSPVLTGVDTYQPSIPIIPQGQESVRFNVIARAEIRTCFVYDSSYVTYYRDNIPRPGLIETVCIDKEVQFFVGEGFDEISWKKNQDEVKEFRGKPTLKTKEPAEYTADLTSRCGIKTVFFTLKNFDEIQLDLGKPKEFCVGEEGFYIINELDSAANKSYKYSWFDLLDNEKLLGKDLINSKYDLKDLAAMKLVAEDTNSCVKSDQVVVSVNDDCFMIPNLITPGAVDNYNNKFVIRGMFPGEWAIEIYNRWGDRVYKNEKYAQEWGGENVSDGVYFYSLKNINKGKEYKGWVQVMNN